MNLEKCSETQYDLGKGSEIVDWEMHNQSVNHSSTIEPNASYSNTFTAVSETLASEQSSVSTNVDPEPKNQAPHPHNHPQYHHPHQQQQQQSPNDCTPPFFQADKSTDPSYNDKRNRFQNFFNGLWKWLSSFRFDGEDWDRKYPVVGVQVTSSPTETSGLEGSEASDL